MHIILGGTGHVGSALSEALISKGERVTVVTSDESKSKEIRLTGAEVAVADVNDTEALRRAFEKGKRLFLLNPPAAPSTNTDVEERKTLISILTALDGSGIEKVVAVSTYGAKHGEQIGDLGILYEMEQALQLQPIPASVIRAAYYMSNWDSALETARDDGLVYSFFPADFKLPMVAPADIGRVAARLMTEPVDQIGLHHVEGPKAYSASELAKAFASVLKKPVEVVEISREKWIDTFKNLGFSDPAAASYAGMSATVIDQNYSPSTEPIRGETTIDDYVNDLVVKNTDELKMNANG